MTPSWVRRILGVRLETKVLGANLVILVFAVAAANLPLASSLGRWQSVGLVIVSLGFGIFVNVKLVRLALEPLAGLAFLARRVSRGNITERVPPSLVADPDLAHLASTMNEMLDSLEMARSRMRHLGAEVASAQEREREQLARDLNDSVAQTLVAAGFHVAAAASEIGRGPGSVPLIQAQNLMRTALEEIRTLSRSLHPRVAVDLGLAAALEGLVDGTRQRSLIDARLTVDTSGLAIPPALGSTLYRIAQEALRDVERHADATTVTLFLSAREGLVELTVSDDGPGTDTAHSSPVLARMRERLSLAGGDLHIDSSGDRGTRVVATMRLETEAA